MWRLVLLAVALEFWVFTQGVFAAIDFQVSNPQVSESNITVSASVSGLTATSCNNGMCYLQAVLKSSTGTHYFGDTQNNDNDWYSYESQPDPSVIQNTFFRFTPESGSWSGQLNVRFDATDAYYTGPGSYTLKLNRFTGKSSSPAGASNELVIQLASPTPTPSVTPTPTPTSTPTATSVSTPTPTATTKVTTSATISPTKIPTQTPTVVATSSNTASTSAILDDSPDVGLVLGSNVEEPTISPQSSEKSPNHSGFPWYGLLILVGGLIAALPLVSFVIRYQRRVLRVLK